LQRGPCSATRFSGLRCVRIDRLRSANALRCRWAAALSGNNHSTIMARRKRAKSLGIGRIERPFVRRMVVVLRTRKPVKWASFATHLYPEKKLGLAGGAASRARTILCGISLLTGKIAGNPSRPLPGEARKVPVPAASFRVVALQWRRCRSLTISPQRRISPTRSVAHRPPRPRTSFARLS
jgi:hypothetical protein